MKLYEIDAAIMGCIDEETGEIIDPVALEGLQMERRQKLRNIALLAINAQADIDSCKKQEERFAKRRRSAERTLAWCKDALACALDGKGMKEPEFVISFTRSKAVDVYDEKALLMDYMRTTMKQEPDKAAIKKAIEAGKNIPGARIVERRNIHIK